MSQHRRMRSKPKFFKINFGFCSLQRLGEEEEDSIPACVRLFSLAFGRFRILTKAPPKKSANKLHSEGKY